MIFKDTRLLALAAAVTLLAGCGGGGEKGASVFAWEVINETRTLSEGQLVSITLAPGTYQGIFSASTNGVKVAWVGGTGCSDAGEVKTYNNICKMGQTGQLVITNPTTFGLGPSEIVTIKILLNP